MERNMPRSLVVIATFLFAATIIALITGESLLFPNALLDYMWKIQPAGRGAISFHWANLRSVPASAWCRDFLCRDWFIARTHLDLVVWRPPLLY